MFCINLPYSLAVTPVYGRATDWVELMTHALIAAGLVFGSLCMLLDIFYIGKLRLTGLCLLMIFMKIVKAE